MYLQWLILAYLITYINNFITLMIRNYLIKIDETHINFDGWYLNYVGTPKHRMSNAAIYKKNNKTKKTSWDTWSQMRHTSISWSWMRLVWSCIIKFNFVILLINSRKFTLLYWYNLFILEPLQDKIKINFSSRIIFN